MSGIDIVIAVIFAGGLIIGYRKGALRQIGSIGGVVAGLIACRLAGDRATALVASLMGWDAPGASSMSVTAAQVVGYGALFLAVWCGVWAIARMLRKATHAMLLGPVDGVAGAVFLAAKWMIVVSLVLNLWKRVDPNSSIFSSSRLAGGAVLDAIMQLTPRIFGFLQEAATNHQLTLL